MTYSYDLNEDGKLSIYINGCLHATLENVDEDSVSLILDDILDDYIKDNNIYADFN